MTVPTQDPGYQAAGAPQHQADEVRGNSLGELMRQVTGDLSTLMRQEVELAKAEIRQEGKKAGKAAGLFGGAGFGGYMVALFVSIAVWQFLDNVMDSGLAALIVAVIWAAVAAVLYSMGKKNAERVRGLKQTNDSVQRIPDALKPHPEGVTR
ncbi:phage holin family protein [Micromonospora sp. WMMD1128]|uniref:phage holin family protein n=1 Tax=unclassified Micromonospora TaxID=2617518 RepID=UPI00248CFCCD|nr:MULTISPECIES: phage holin family protein [unclassified Micromonospora]WBB74957.1 phage holin family protein [Micromonospora sp. WMMD1128]WFE31667.1 phage holin family protein [Micromonospora sp. WMMD975]